jgi:FKBP-type peptidyl-prolyl cis-trans isomerase FklB
MVTGASALINLRFMKSLLIASVTVLLVTPLFAQEKSTPPKDPKDKVSYSIGLNIGFNLSKQQVPVNPDALAAGIKDGLAGKPQMTEAEVKETMAAFEKDMIEKQKAAGEKNATEGAKYLEENKKKEGVKTTTSGLQYKSLKEGSGPQPKATDTVTVNYRGTLTDGTEFDSSFKHNNEPATFPLNNVIKGWTEGVQLMKEGSKYQFVIPAALAYGDRSPGAGIPPNSVLVFEIELLKVKSGAEASPAPSAIK